MTFETTANAFGGLALFMLAMLMMTEGLKTFAGSGLRSLLDRSTSTPLRGVFSGILVTGIVQSSSAVTVATIGFVNAGVLTLRQALGVVFGANVGTTITGWLVSAVGFGFDIQKIALPLLAVGVVLRLAAPGKRYRGLGEALAGFGLFFLGLSILKDAFAGIASAYGTTVAGTGGGGWPAFVLVGFFATVLTQSSSAAIAIILTAAAGGVVGLQAAAAAVIGANLGTTSTAAVAVIGATPSAKRLALGHIGFNLITGAVALVVMPGMLWVVATLADRLEVESSPAAVLALFHTVFNVLGVLIMLPLARRLGTLLESLFRSAEEDISRPQHIDATLTGTPSLAVAALREELLRLQTIVTKVAARAASPEGETMPPVEREVEATQTLGLAIARFVAAVGTESMPRDVVDDLASALRVSRYLDEAAQVVPRAEALRREVRIIEDASLRAALEDVMRAAGACISLTARSAGDAEASEALERFGKAYQHSKAELLLAAAARRIGVESVDAVLDASSSLRRLVDQLTKADRLICSKIGSSPIAVPDSSRE